MSHKAFANKATKSRKKAIYMEVTLDEYELPVAVADSMSELDRMPGSVRKWFGPYKRPGGRL